MGMKERNGEVKGIVVKNTTSRTLQANIHNSVKSGSTVITDDNRSYLGIDSKKYTHFSVNHSAKEYVNGMAHTNGIESFWTLLKRGYHGTFHTISTKHLQKYVDEFSFRINNQEDGTLCFIKKVIEGSVGRDITYKRLIKGVMHKY